MKKVYIIKAVFNDSFLAKNEYGYYGLIYITGGLNYPGNNIKTFETKEEAESYIVEKEMSEVMIIETYKK